MGATPQKSAPKAKSLQKKIVLVGDFYRTIDRESGIFLRTDLEVFTTVSGKEAFDIHSREKANLMAIDLSITDPDPEILCRQIRDSLLLKNISILIIGAKTPADRERFGRCNANLYLEKPLSDLLFQKTVAHMISISPRSTYRVKVSIRVTSRIRAEAFSAFSVNLSTTGMLLSTDRSLAKGDQIECSLALASFGLLSVQAEVVRIFSMEGGKFAYGVRFLKMSMQDMTTLQSFLNDHLKLQAQL